MVANDLPEAFNAESEQNKFLAKCKSKAAKNFSIKRQSSLSDSGDLALWLYVFRRHSEAAEVCRFVGLSDFDGNHNLWSFVETTLALQSRIARECSKKQESKQCLDRIINAGIEKSRLEGSLLHGRDGYRQQIKQALKEQDSKSEVTWRRIALSELCFIVELGAGKKFKKVEAESEFQENLNAIRATLDSQILR